MIDSHAHLYFEAFDDDREAVLRRAREAGVDRIINIGIDPDTSEQAIELARGHAGLFATVGIHPTSEVDDPEEALEAIRALATADRGRVVAIGEIGLDYHWKNVPPEVQRPRLESQLALARELDYPVVFHCREALDDLLDLLESDPRRPPGVLHCFSGGPVEARRALEMGYCVSFAGNVTFPKAEELRAAARAVPPERLLLETDSPFLAPHPRRGKRNEPAFVAHLRDALAELHDLAPRELEEITVRNTERLFRLGAA